MRKVERVRRFAIWLPLLLLAACGSPGTESPATTAATSGPLLPTRAAFPLEIAADNGPVTIAAVPQRIVSLSPSHTEMLYALGVGDRLVGTDLHSNFPVQANATPKVDAFNFSAEAVAALQPDLVVLAFDFQGELEALANLGITVVLLGPATTLEDSYHQVEVLGAAVGEPAQGAKQAEMMQNQIDRLLKEVLPTRELTVYHEVDASLYAASSTSLVGDIYRRLGLGNIADPIDQGSGFPQLNPEYVIGEDPDLIFLDGGGKETPASVAARPGWRAITAVEQGAVTVLDEDLAGRWGPRTPQLVEAVVSALRETITAY